MSLINNSNVENIQFVSYTGKYPNLCSGVLTLIVRDKEYIFGHDYSKSGWEKDGHLEKFWSSGGNCGFSGGYKSSYIHSGGVANRCFKAARRVKTVCTGN